MEKLVKIDDNKLRGFFGSKKIFITGHTGFKGAWLSLLLKEYGSVIKGYSLPPQYEKGIFDYLEKDNFKISEFGDIVNREQLTASIKEFQPDLIFHLAAQPLVRKSYDLPIETLNTNVMGTSHVLHAIQTINKKCAVIVITTDKVYRNFEDGRSYKESDYLGGFDPYSSSKACTELLTESFRNSFYNLQNFDTHKKSLATARAGNVIGGGDWSEDRLIPDIVRHLQYDKVIEIRNPDSVRPWQHVLEPLIGYLKLAYLVYNDPQNFSQAFNFGPEKEDHYSVGEIVNQAISAWGSGSWTKIGNDLSKHEAGLLQLDITKAKNKLSWEPKLRGSQAIEWTMEWYKASDKDKLIISKKQILNYTSNGI